MPSFTCAHCAQKVPVTAAQCPHCGKSPRKSDPVATVINTVFAAVAALSVAWCFGAFDSPESYSPPEPDASGAYAVCQDAVEGRLRSPRSARFPWSYTDRVMDLGDGRFRVRAYVDAENAFGAEVRTDFDCTVAWEGNDTWSVEALELTPR